MGYNNFYNNNYNKVLTNETDETQSSHDMEYNYGNKVYKQQSSKSSRKDAIWISDEQQYHNNNKYKDNNFDSKSDKRDYRADNYNYSHNQYIPEELDYYKKPMDPKPTQKSKTNSTASTPRNEEGLTDNDSKSDVSIFDFQFRK